MATEQPAVARRHAIREKLETRLISEPLRGKMLDFVDRRQKARDSGAADPQPESYEVMFEVNLNNILGRTGSRDVIFTLLGRELRAQAGPALAINRPESTHPYIFAHLTVDQIFAVAQADSEQAKAEHPMTKNEAAAGAVEVYRAIMAFDAMQRKPAAAPSIAPLPMTLEVSRMTPVSGPASAPQAPPANANPQPTAAKPAALTQTRGPGAGAHRAIFRIWESQKVHPLTIQSIQTVKAKPAHNSFGALGEDVSEPTLASTTFRVAA